MQRRISVVTLMVGVPVEAVEQSGPPLSYPGVVVEAVEVGIYTSTASTAAANIRP